MCSTTHRGYIYITKESKLRIRFKKNKETFEGLCSQAHNLRRKLAELNDETTNTRQQLSVVLSSIETFSANINVELNQSRDEFGVKPELWF